MYLEVGKNQDGSELGAEQMAAHSEVEGQPTGGVETLVMEVLSMRSCWTVRSTVGVPGG